MISTALRDRSVEGVLLVDKPRDWTSHDVCAFVRKRFKVKKVGHAGTLDPLATGLLVLLLGRATKRSQDLSAQDKDYVGIMELGVKTDSHDRQGKVLETAPWEAVTLEQIREKAVQFCGEITQVPPMVSALKHKGVRLYQLARKGVEVAREPRPIQVHSFHLESKEGPFVHFAVRVSKGTYVRTLVSDLGDALGCCAALADLRRVRSGEHSLDGALTIENLKAMSSEEFSARILPLPLPPAAHGNI